MGTSHRHKAGVTGEPNWGRSSSSVTQISKTIEKSEELTNNPPVGMPQKTIERKQRSYERSIRYNYHQAIRNIVKAAGGRPSVSSGKSRALGHAGISWAISWTQAFQEIAEQGLQSWLSSHGIDSLEGKSCKEIIGLIDNFIGDNVVGLDTTAAKDAMSHILQLIEKRSENDPQKLDDVFSTILSTDEIKDYVDQFFGIYVYCHISQNYYEKIEKERGTEVAKKTMAEIKALVLDDVSRGVYGKPAGKVNWKGREGQSFIQHELDRMIKIMEADED